MADGDIVIADSATEAAPHEYVVKGAEYFAIKQVQALFTDNGAGGNWLPALEIVAPPRIVTGRYVGTSVTAGSDQEVTFHPLGSKGAAAPTPPAVSGAPNIATLWRSQDNNADAPQAVNAHSSVAIQFPHQSLPSDGSVSWNAGTPYFLVWNVDAFAIQMLWTRWDGGNYNRSAFSATSSRILFANTPNPAAISGLASDPASGDDLWTMEVKPNAFVTNDVISTGGYNGDAVQHHITEAWWVTYFWKVTGYTGGIPGWPA